VAKKRTADADMKLDDRGRRIEDSEELAAHENVLIVDPTAAPATINRAPIAQELQPVVEAKEKTTKKK
jgi:hypothetical protein